MHALCRNWLCSRNVQELEACIGQSGKCQTWRCHRSVWLSTCRIVCSVSLLWNCICCKNMVDFLLCEEPMHAYIRTYITLHYITLQYITLYVSFLSLSPLLLFLYIYIYIYIYILWSSLLPNHMVWQPAIQYTSCVLHPTPRSQQPAHTPDSPPPPAPSVVLCTHIFSNIMLMPFD